MDVFRQFTRNAAFFRSLFSPGGMSESQFVENSAFFRYLFKPSIVASLPRIAVSPALARDRNEHESFPSDF
jgi:hypothetical protein